MNLKHYISMIRVTVFLSCIFFLCTAFGYRQSDYCKMARRITKIYLKECAIPHRLMLTGYGGAMMRDIKEIFLDFLSYDTLNIDEARTLYVEMMEEFLQRINCHEKIRPHLHNFPFGVDNIKLSIGFEDSERKITHDGHVALMFIGNNQDLFYRAYNAEGEGFYALHKEPYEEALRIVKESSSSDSTKER